MWPKTFTLTSLNNASIGHRPFWIWSKHPVLKIPTIHRDKTSWLAWVVQSDCSRVIMVWPLFNGYKWSQKLRHFIQVSSNHCRRHPPTLIRPVIQAFPLAHLIPTHVNVSSISIQHSLAENCQPGHLIPWPQWFGTKSYWDYHASLRQWPRDAKKPSNENMNSLPAFPDGPFFFTAEFPWVLKPHAAWLATENCAGPLCGSQHNQVLEVANKIGT